MSIFSNDQLEKMADDAYKNRKIATSTYCGKCGYNLRTLPYVYVCPECGSAYNARPLAMKGIFVNEQLRLPVREFFLAAVMGALAAVFAVSGVRPTNPAWLALAGLAALISTISFYTGIAQWRQLGHARFVAKRIAEEEG